MLAGVVYCNGEGCGWSARWWSCGWLDGVAGDHGVRGAVWLSREWLGPWVIV